MTQPTIEIVDLTEIVGDIEIACEFNGELVTWDIGEHDDPAKWVLFGKCGDCGHSPVRLSCTRCKDTRTSTQAAAIICRACNKPTVPAPHFYRRIEALS